MEGCVGLKRSFWAARTALFHGAYNALARNAPQTSAAIQRLTHDTGRGGGRDGAAGADYFESVAHDYEVIADASGACAHDLFRGRRVLELGPGDTRAIALISRLEGASAWEGFDAFDIQSRRRGYLDGIYAPIFARRGESRSLSASLIEGCIMHTSAGALRRGGHRFDLVVSRAVLEHVRDLEALFALVADVVTDDAIAIHKVDLRSHGIRHEHELDFLRFPESVWSAMSSHIDIPNRKRLDTYLGLGERAGLHTAWIATTHVIAPAEVAQIRSDLAPPFCAVSPEVLRVLGLWLVQVGRAHPLANRALPPIEPAPHERLSKY